MVKKSLNLQKQFESINCSCKLILYHHFLGSHSFTNCECGASEQTADHILTVCPIHRTPHGARGLTV